LVKALKTGTNGRVKNKKDFSCDASGARAPRGLQDTLFHSDFYELLPIPIEAAESPLSSGAGPLPPRRMHGGGEAAIIEEWKRQAES
jgi:hypothetical protein